MRVGDKVKFVGKGMKYFWFLNVIENAKKLDRSAVYTISEITELSSWTCVRLNETGTADYNSVWFKKI